MPAVRHASLPTRYFVQALLGGLGLLLAAAVVLSAYAGWVLAESRPSLTGSLRVDGLASAVQVDRDGQGIPTITAASRIDLARALGFLHGQERFFEMDLLRRAGAGELSGLVGAAALGIDRERRVHRFRARAEANLASQSVAQRALVAAYTAGVNAGLARLGHAPWEYTLLRARPSPWTEADTSLVVYAMYFDLQPSDASGQEASAAVRDTLGPALADYLLPRGTRHDAAVDGSVLPEPPMPDSLPASVRAADRPAEATPASPAKGSNNFAVSGRLTATGAAMVANDMHLGLTVPNIWYRARMRTGPKAAPALDLNGVTLPGTPFLVVGSNSHVAWGFTDGYIESGDAVLIDPVPGNPQQYRTPAGSKPITTEMETLCPIRAPCQSMRIEETIWGPVVGRAADGRRIVWRWTAHDATAVMTNGFTGLETAHTVREALDAAHTAGLPQQNLLVGDEAGHIAWTIIGQVPRRVGLDDQLPHSWADGTHRWDGYLPASDIPEIIDPPSGRLWSANARVVGGTALERLGDGGYAEGQRASRLRDTLAARTRFEEADFLAIQNDTRAAVLDGWQRLLLAAIEAHAAEPRIAALRDAARSWGGRAVPNSVGYRLVEQFRRSATRRILGALLQPAEKRLGVKTLRLGRSDWPVERLLTERPTGLVPPPYKDWDAVTAAALGDILDSVAAAGGTLQGFTWGGLNHTGIHHPLARFVPLLGLLTDPPDVPVAGDAIVPRVALPGFGASERLVVSPGHEASALLDMPMGEAGNPLTPYYGAGQAAWVAGTAEPLLPGAARWRLQLVP